MTIVEDKYNYYYCTNTELHPNGEVIQIRTTEENPRCPYCGAVMTYGRYWGPLPATQLKEAKGSPYWWVRLGDVAEYERFDTLEEAQKHVEEATGKPFSEAHWINKYGFTLGSYQGLNYISFFEGDEEAQPTEQHLYGKP